MTDSALILRARGGDELAFRRLLDRHRDLLIAKSYRLYAPGLTDDDLRQEAQVGLHKAVRDWRASGGASFREFAALCIERQVFTAVKTATRGKHSSLNGADSLDGPAGRDPDQRHHLAEVVPDPKSDPEATAVNRETLRLVHNAVWSDMTELERESVMGIASGLSYREIAETHRTTTKSVDNALQRAKRKLYLVVDGQAA